MIYHGNRCDDGRGSLTDLGRNVDRTVEALQPFSGHFDAIICTGMSGTLVAAPVSLRLGKVLAVVRKEESGKDRTHDFETILGRMDIHGKRVLFLDDFVSGGYTRSRCFRAVAKCGGTVVAQYLYRDDRLTPIGLPAYLIMEGDGWTGGS